MMHESYKKWLDDGCPKVICNCGCGKEIIIKQFHKYRDIPKHLKNHDKRNKPCKGHPCSKETKEQLSIRMKENNPMKNPEIAKKCADSNRGNTKYHRICNCVNWINKNQGKYFCGCGCGIEIILTKRNFYNKKQSKFFVSGHSFKGKHHTDEQKEKIINANKLNGNYNRSSKRMRENNPMKDQKQRIKLSIRMKKSVGEKSHNWQGGISFLPYSKEFNNKLRLEIRKRDNNTCQECGAIINYYKNLSVHHIDYNKNNNSPNNLICLCVSCHPKTNNNRKKWTKKYQKIINLKNEKKYELQLTFK